MYNLIYTTYDGIVSVVLCHEDKNFLNDIVEDVKKYNLESFALLKTKIGPFDSDYIHKNEIEEIEKELFNLKSSINSYINLINNDVDKEENSKKYSELISRMSFLEIEKNKLAAKEQEHISNVLKDRKVFKTNISNLFRPQIIKIAERYSFNNLSIQQVKHFNEF